MNVFYTIGNHVKCALIGRFHWCFSLFNSQLFLWSIWVDIIYTYTCLCFYYKSYRKLCFLPLDWCTFVTTRIGLYHSYFTFIGQCQFPFCYWTDVPSKQLLLAHITHSWQLLVNASFLSFIGLMCLLNSSYWLISLMADCYWSMSVSFLLLDWCAF